MTKVHSNIEHQDFMGFDEVEGDLTMNQEFRDRLRFV
jgi:hypothetical protein